MARSGFVIVKDAILVPQRSLMAFRIAISTFRIPRDYTIIWENLQRLLSSYEPMRDLDGRSHELDWTFIGNKRFSMISTNYAYHNLIGKIWDFHKFIT